MKIVSTVVVATVALSTVLSGAAFAASSPTAPGYKPPRLADGKPSLEGNWTNASLTGLTRSPRFKELVIPADQIDALTNAHPQVVRQRTDDATPDREANTNLDGKDLKSGRGYNAFWIDPGMTYAKVKGEYRTSFIVDPANGQIPFKDGARRGPRIADEEGEGVRGSFDGPEARPLGERCVINSGSAGPPMMTYLYNNNYEIVQTGDSVAIRVEMENYARVVRIGGKHVPDNVRPIYGDSIGHWDGDTLVIETTNFSPLHANSNLGLTAQGKVTERLTRYSKDQILYEFTVEDPSRYAQPWRGEMSFNSTDKQVYEYACHEGNYALEGTLAGAREEEKRQAAGKPKP
jgi:hypothetical protein